MANTEGASLGPIYDRLHSAPQYHPLEADTFADWSIEAGDIVTVTRDGNSYSSPVHHTTVQWRKGQKVTVSSTGSRERKPLSQMSQKKFVKGTGGGGGLRNSQYIHFHVEDLYGQMATGLELTASSAHLYAYNKYREMGTGLKLTASSAVLYAYNKYKEMSTGLKLTASSAHLYARNKYLEMQTGLKLTASSAVLYAYNKYKEMGTGLQLTASSAHLYARNKYLEMQTGLSLTASSAVLYAYNKYKEMGTGLSLTASSANLYAYNKYKEMGTGLSLTASSAILYAYNKYKEMTSGLSLTASSAVLYAQGRTSRAEIVARINEDGQSQALIRADKITLDGTSTTIKQLLTGDATVAKLVATDLRVKAQAGMGDISVTGCINTATVSNNTLTLYDMTGSEVVSFSKATTLSGEWSGRNYIVTATQNGVEVGRRVGTVYDTIVGTGAADWEYTSGSYYARRTFNVYSQDPYSGDADHLILQKALTINADSVYAQGYSNGYNDGGGGNPERHYNSYWLYCSSVSTGYATTYTFTLGTVGTLPFTQGQSYEFWR